MKQPNLLNHTMDVLRVISACRPTVVTMPPTMVPGIAARLIGDLRASVAYAQKAAGLAAKSPALYGISGTAKNNKMATELMLGMFDILYEV